MRAVAGALALLLVNTFPSCSYTILDDGGGELTVYEQRYRNMAATGELVVVDGPCYSACTMVLSFIPPSHLCVTPRALFGFHRAYLKYRDGTRGPDDLVLTYKMFQGYPLNIQDWLLRRGGVEALPSVTSGEWWILPGSQSGVKPCIYN